MFNQIIPAFKKTLATLKSLWAWYKKLSPLNKIGFWGSIASLIGLSVAFCGAFCGSRNGTPTDDRITTFPTNDVAFQNQIRALQIRALQKSIDDLIKLQEDQPDAPPGIKEALERLKEGDTQKAEAIFQKLKEHKIDEGQAAHREAATAARRLGALASWHDTKKALNAYRQATELDPENIEGWIQLGYILDRIGQSENAETAYQHVLELSKKRENEIWMPRAYKNLGNLYLSLGDLKKAEAMYQKSEALYEIQGDQEGRARIYSNRGFIYEKYGDLAKAKEMHEESFSIFKALDHPRGMAMQYNNLGNLYQAYGDLVQPKEMYLKALEIYEMLGNKEKKTYNYADKVYIYGNTARSRSNLGNLYLRRRELTQAEEEYRQRSYTAN